VPQGKRSRASSPPTSSRKNQGFTVHNVVSSGSTAVAEVTWSGKLAVGIGALQPGSTMTARFCIVLEIADGRIEAQRNYDCFDPF
jgi:hypothetical protein